MGNGLLLGIFYFWEGLIVENGMCVGNSFVEENDLLCGGFVVGGQCFVMGNSLLLGIVL